MSSVNKVILVGHLGKDPEARSFQNGGEIVNMSIATSERWKDRLSGEQKERTEWHNIVIMNEGLLKVAKQYLRKGSKVYIEGALRTRKWQDNTGNDRWSTEIVLGAFNSTLVLLDRREADPGRTDYSSYGDTCGGSAAGNIGGTTGGSRGTFTDDLDDDVPF
nr:single-stranded DNA-binding protein [Sphingomonas sp. Leaf205]